MAIHRREESVLPKVVLVLMLLFGLGLNVFALLDSLFFHLVLVPPTPSPVVPDGRTSTEELPSNLEGLRRSILLVKADGCDAGGSYSTGTGFVVRPGYVTTAAHVVSTQQRCGGEIRVVDSQGLESRAELEGVSSGSDLALLRITDDSLPPLPILDSMAYETVSTPTTVVTIGYPLLGTGSSADRAALSGDGNLSRYDASRGLLVTSGLSLNPGNSGGPVFVKDSWKVLGVVSAILDPAQTSDVGFVIPSRVLATFFREKTGQELW